MALPLQASLSSASACTFTRLQPRSCILAGSFSNGYFPSRVKCMVAKKAMSDKTIIRRSANYQPSKWGYDYIQSLTSRYVGELYAKRIKNLKEDVRLMLDKEMDVDALHQMVLVDNLQRLGVSYHFPEEIERIMNRIYSKNCGKFCDDKQEEESLYAVALEFRLLKQHGFDIPAAETFSSFMDEKGKFMSSHSDDCKGILALYEAAYFLVERENDIFHDAVHFTTVYLKEYVKHNNDEYLVKLVNHALELPLHWRVPRLEARWFIDIYETGPGMNTVLLEFAKLDFNIVQATHQEDLKYSSRWWRKTGLAEKLSFARDRLMECFFWSVGMIFEPHCGYVRRILTKVNAYITTIDDVYDVYGTLEELKLFTDAVDRWDANAMEQLPCYMKICFLSLYNDFNEMAFNVLKEQGVNIIPYLRRVWADLCKSYLLEAKWFSSGYIPTLEEYMNNAWISISAPVILMHAYISTTNSITKEALEYLQEYPDIIRWSSMILRLADDLGTSSHEIKRGDVAKSIQCYMHETGASEEEAREHIQELIAATWLKMNTDRFGNPHLSNTPIDIATNLARMAQCMYQYGDGHASQDGKTVDRILSLFIHPIPHIEQKSSKSMTRRLTI